MNYLELIRFKSLLSLCVSFWNIYKCICFVSVFELGECIVGECVLVFTLNTCANNDIHLHQYETRVFDFWPQLLPLHTTIR